MSPILETVSEFATEPFYIRLEYFIICKIRIWIYPAIFAFLPRSENGRNRKKFRLFPLDIIHQQN